MGSFIDLRGHNIKTDDDVIEFLELFENKISQIKHHMKRQKFRRVSLENQVAHLNRQLRAEGPVMEVVDTNAGVTERLEGNTRPVQTEEQKRLAQLRNVQTVEETVPADPVAPLAPGEIGHLEVPAIDGKAPEEPAEEETTFNQFQLEDDVYQQVVVGGSYRYKKNGKFIKEEVFNEARLTAEGAPAPSEEDMKAVGDLVAEKTDNGKNR